MIVIIRHLEYSSLAIRAKQPPAVTRCPSKLVLGRPCLPSNKTNIQMLMMRRMADECEMEGSLQQLILSSFWLEGFSVSGVTWSVWPELLNKAKNKTNKNVDIWTKYWTRQSEQWWPGMHQRRREEQVLFLTTQSAHPLDSRFHNHGQIYCYFIFINDRVMVGAAWLKVDGCWLDDNPEIFASAIICQVLSTITSIPDIGHCTLHRPGY